MVDISSGDKKINITVSTSGNRASVNATPDTAMYYSNKSREWAISDKIVDNEDYSSKYYANESKKQAQISTTKTEEVVNSGNEALSNIETAKTNAISDITNQETLSVDNVNTAGATQVTNINNAGTTQVNNVNSTGTTQINLAKEQVTLATNQANIATEQATIATNKASEVVESGNTALSSIDTAKSSAITDITDLKNDSISSINTAKSNAILSISNQEITSKNKVIKAGDEQIERINLTGIDSKADKKDTLNNSQITNCILEAPSGVFVQNTDGYYYVPKGTRFLSADGKDINGKIKNLDVTLTGNVVFSGIPSTSSGLIMLFLMSLDKTTWGIGLRDYKVQWYEQNTMPNIADGTWFNTDDYIWRNIQTADGDGKWYNFNAIPIALVNLTNGVVDKIYKVFEPVEILTNNYRLSNLNMVNYNEPTAIPFDTEFTAPADGKVFVMSHLDCSANYLSPNSYIDCAGFINPVRSGSNNTITKTATQEYRTVGTYTFNAPSTGWYKFILVGGGGHGISQLNMYAVAANGGGGSGAAFAGQVYLTAGSHTITVGGANGASSIDGIVVAGGGGNASMNNLANATAGTGGAISVTGQTQNVTILSNGNSGATGIGSHVPGGASLYNGWGSGGGSNSSPATGYAYVEYQYTEQVSSTTITGTVVYSNYVRCYWDNTANTVASGHNTSDWIDIEKGQKILFATTLKSEKLASIIEFVAKFYPNKREME